MAITVGNSEPVSFTIGDTVSWTRSESDYPAPTWNLVWGFTGPTRFTVTSTDYNTTDHEGTLPTSGLKPGRYYWTVKATDGTNTITLTSGFTDALPDLTAADAELDAAEAQLAKVEAAYNAFSTNNASQVSIDGVQFTSHNIHDLKASREAARREVARLRAARAALLRRGSGNIFVTRFCN